MTNWLSLSAEPSAVRWGRASVLSWLKEWGLAHDHLIETAQLIASEVLTNAVRHAGTPHQLPGYVGRGLRRLVAVRLRQHGGSVFVDVWDSSAVPPTIRAADLNSEGGRGMALVAELSKKWGAWRVPPEMGVGKVVWAEMSIAPPPVKAPEEEPVAIPTPGPVAAPTPQPHPLAAPGQVPRPGQVPGHVAPRPGPGQVPRPGQAGPRPGQRPVAPVPGQVPRPVAMRRRGAAGPVATRPGPVVSGPVPLWAAERKKPYRPPGGWRTDLKPAEFEQIIDALAALPA